MNAQILKGKDGRRWLLVEGCGLCTELKAAPEPVKVMPVARKKRRKKWDGF